MICLHIQFHYLATLLLRKCPDTVFNFFSYLARKNPEPIFRDSDNLILAVPYGLYHAYPVDAERRFGV